MQKSTFIFFLYYLFYPVLVKGEVIQQQTAFAGYYVQLIL
jgi:hypothetical protein